MEGNGFKVPEVLQIKGYKYRAKMLIAAAVLLIIFILILSLIIHGISSAVRGASKDSGSDTDSAKSGTNTASDVAVVSSIPDIVSAAESSGASSAPAAYREEKFNADGKLEIDTDTLDGKKAIAITFDDGPSEYTMQLLEGLNERNAKATFFMVGSNVSQYPDVVSYMASTGHQIGNHTYDHTDIASAGLNAAKASIEKTDEAIEAACGKRSTAFRPPYGSFTDEIAKKIDKTFTIWSLDTLDWKSRDTKKIKNIIVSQSRDGSIILLHDLYKTSVDGALAAIDELQGEGFVFVTVDELMTRYGYPINPGAHSAQYAVYETNSPHAGDYAADMERDRAKDEASASAGSFYYDKQETDSDKSKSSSAASSEADDEYYDWDEDEEYYYDEDENWDDPVSSAAANTAASAPASAPESAPSDDAYRADQSSEVYSEPTLAAASSR